MTEISKKTTFFSKPFLGATSILAVIWCVASLPGESSGGSQCLVYGWPFVQLVSNIEDREVELGGRLTWCNEIQENSSDSFYSGVARGPGVGVPRTYKLNLLGLTANMSLLLLVVLVLGGMLAKVESWCVFFSLRFYFVFSVCIGFVALMMAHKEKLRNTEAMNIAFIANALSLESESHVQVCVTNKRQSVFDMFCFRLLHNFGSPMRAEQFFQGRVSDVDFYFPGDFDGLDSQVKKNEFFKAWNRLNSEISLEAEHSPFVAELLNQPGSVNIKKLKLVFSAESQLAFPVHRRVSGKATYFQGSRFDLIESAINAKRLKSLINAHMLNIANLEKLNCLEIQLCEGSDQQHQLKCFEINSGRQQLSVSNANSTGIEYMLSSKWPSQTVFEFVDTGISYDLINRAEVYFSKATFTRKNNEDNMLKF